MKFYVVSLSLACLLVSNASQATTYSKIVIEGNQVYLSSDLTSKVKKSNATVDFLRSKLQAIYRNTPRKHHPFFKSIKIWIEDETQNVHRLVYYPSGKKVHGVGNDPRKARSIVIHNAESYLATAKNQPWILLHEFSHAYFHQILKGKFMPVQNAYKNANQKGLYKKISKNDGTIVDSYALTDYREYFAELTESYFGENNFYPFTRLELKNYDPVGFRAIKKAWNI